MSKTLYAAMLIAISSYMAPAFAVPIASTTALGDITDLSADLGNTFGKTSVGLLFSDVYTFDLTSISQTAATTVALNYSFGKLDFSLSNMAISLTDSTGSTVYASDNTLDASNALWIDALLNPGVGYRLVVTGMVTGTNGGSYGGALAALPVPEAKTYAMLLAGLGMVGFMARRRARV